MELIQAAHNLTIELGPTTWMLFNGSQLPEQPDTLIALFTARTNEIRCSPAFARARQLPGEGRLEPVDVARVVVGWAPESRNWHLGLLLAARPETNFTMRWCGLASWPSSAPGDHSTQARLAGQALARVISRPFHMVPPPPEPPNPLLETQPVEITTPMMAVGVQAPEPVVETPAPPFVFEDWSMEVVPRGVVWQRGGKWLVSTGLRALIFGVMAVLFMILGFGSQGSGLAAVNPAWLPWVGVAVGVMMAISAVRHLWLFLTVTDTLIDVNAREVRCQSRFTAKPRWQIPFDAVAYVLVSQTPARSIGRKASPRHTEQDVWLHIYDGDRFWPVAGRLEGVQGRCHDWDTVRSLQKKRGRRQLRLAHYDTPAHHAAEQMAETIGCGIWLDIR